MNTGGVGSAAKVTAETSATVNGAAKPAANTVNERTYQEVEYLKKNLGPILVAALAEICIRRPADPIEYLGHWLLRWRYNEELKRRDVQNALDVVRQRQWAQVQDETAAVKVEKYADGFTPDQPHGPPGYGGPLSGEELGENGQQEVQEAEFHPPEEVTGEGAEIQGEAGGAHPSFYQHLAGGPSEGFSSRSQNSLKKQSMDAGQRKNSQGQPIEGERRASQLEKSGHQVEGSNAQVPILSHSKAQPQPPPPGERKVSLEPAQKVEGERRASHEKEKRASIPGAPPPVLPPVPATSAPAAAPVAPAPGGERKISLEPGQSPGGGERKHSKAPEGSVLSAPPTEAGSAEPPPGDRKLSDAAKQPPPPPEGRKLSDAAKQPHPPPEDRKLSEGAKQPPPPPEGRKLSEAAKQPPPPPEARKVSDASKQPPPPPPGV